MRIYNFVQQTFADKSIYRILFNLKVKEQCSSIKGSVLDLASGKDASYQKLLSENLDLIQADLKQGSSSKIDFNERLPFADKSFDYILFFNAIYIAKDPVFTLREANRVLKDHGTLFLSSPFISNEMPEPNDFTRFTAEGLEKILTEAGFKNLKIERFGERFTSASYLIHPLLFFNFIRLIVNGLSIILDSMIPKKVRNNYPVPLGYFVVSEK